MNFAEFKHSMINAQPPADLSTALNALWYAGKNDWDKAHDYCQQEEGQHESDWVHAYLHREEGDLPNAGYWYRRAEREMPENSLKEEWAEIVTELLNQQQSSPEFVNN